MEEELTVKKKLQKQIENEICNIVDEGFEISKVELLGQLVDIHKDLANEDYWETKKGAIEMNYREYGEGYSEGYGAYGRRRRDSRGRYMAGRGGNRGGNRGGSYQGEEMLEDMHEQYQRYSEGKEDMNMGNYGAHSSTMKSLEYMLESVVEFIEMLKKDAGSQEEVELIKKYTREISEM